MVLSTVPGTYIVHNVISFVKITYTVIIINTLVSSDKHP